MAESPVIFLDIDGVMNATHMSWTTLPIVNRRGAPGRPRTVAKRHLLKTRNWSGIAVANLNQLQQQLGAVLVLTSSWRLRPGVLADLEQRGITGPWHHNWRTDDLPGGRGAQIDRWIATNADPCHVILDDWLDELMGQRKRLVLVSDIAALTVRDVRAARNIVFSQIKARKQAFHGAL